MKTLVLLLLTVLPIMAQTSYNQSPASQAAVQPFDRLGRENISVKATPTSGGQLANSAGDKRDVRKVSVETRPVGTSTPATVEFFLVLKSIGSGAKPTASLAKSFVTETGEAKVDLEGAAPGPKTDIMGWFIRVVRDNKIVGVAASAQTYIPAAENPAILRELRLAK